LWKPDSALRKLEEFRYKHPDNISMVLIKRLWEYLQSIDVEANDGDEKSP
jgi:hypothetical protein